eukprot:scaffold135089_cov18-Tisochrysis_lutea.AAC.2
MYVTCNARGGQERGCCDIEYICVNGCVSAIVKLALEVFTPAAGAESKRKGAVWLRVRPGYKTSRDTVVRGQAGTGTEQERCDSRAGEETERTGAS